MMRSHHQYVSLRNDRTDYTINDYIMSQRRITHIKSVTKKNYFVEEGSPIPFLFPSLFSGHLPPPLEML